MIKLYRYIEGFWFNKIPEKLRFLLVGGFNTVFSYTIFAFLYEVIKLDYNIALALQYVITVNVSVLTMRYYVFRSCGDFMKEFCKAWGVYIFLYFFNAAVLNFFVIVLELYPLLAQALYLVISTIITFIMHKYLSFRKRSKDNQS